MYICTKKHIYIYIYELADLSHQRRKAKVALRFCTACHNVPRLTATLVKYTQKAVWNRARFWESIWDIIWEFFGAR